MSGRSETVARVSAHCDLAERLTLVPPSARVRGLYFRSIEAVLGRAGKLDEYKAIFPERFAAVMWHPAGEFLERLVIGGALLSGPERVHEGMFEIGRRNAIAFAESLLGRTMLRLLSRDPRKLLQQGVAGRRQSYSHGRWVLEFPAERRAIMSMEEEYLYIESYLLGAAQGTFDAIGVPVRTSVVLETPFFGKHILDWE